MKQRLAIAPCRYARPQSFLILDEPINGLDPIGIAEVRSFIRELCDARGKTIWFPVIFFRRFPCWLTILELSTMAHYWKKKVLRIWNKKQQTYPIYSFWYRTGSKNFGTKFPWKPFFHTGDRNLRLHNLELPVGKIVTAFVENGIGGIGGAYLWRKSWRLLQACGRGRRNCLN